MSECPPHHWLLQEPIGTTVPGACKRCGTEKTFKQTVYTGLIDGRPFLIHDPLPPRSLADGYGITNWTA